MKIKIQLLIFLLIFSGCGVPHGRFKKGGFEYDRYQLTIPFNNPEKKLLISEDWRIDNWRTSSSGEILDIKRGENYLGYFYYDKDNDGTIDYYNDRDEIFFFDVKLNNKKTNGVIWLKTIDLPEDQEEKEIDVLFKSYIEGLSGAGAYKEINIFNIQHIKEKKYATIITDKENTVIGGIKFIAATIDMLNIDQLKVTPNYVERKLRIIMGKVDYKGTRYESMNKTVRKALMIIGYVNTPEYFDRNLQDFELFRDNIQIGMTRKYR